jgi:hypothetical protein
VSGENKTDYLPEEGFWDIRSELKAFIIRGIELVFLIIFIFAGYFSRLQKPLLPALAVGIPVVTTFSFIIYKSYGKLSEKISRRKNKAIRFLKDNREYIGSKVSYVRKRIDTYFYE